MNPDQTFPVKIIKQSSTNSGIFYNNSNNRLEFDLPMGMNVNPALSSLEIDLNVNATDSAAAAMPNKMVTFYDKVALRNVSADVLFKNAYWKVSGNSLQLDSSPNHNVRACTEMQFSQDWIDQNSQSLNGNSIVPNPSNSSFSSSIVMTSPQSTLVKIPLSNFFGLAAGRSSYLTSQYGSTKLIFELDDTKPDPFKVLPDTTTTGDYDIYDSLYGAKFACNNTACGAGVTTIPSIVLTLPQSWTDAASSPFSAVADLNKVKLMYNEIVAGVATARSIFATVTDVDVDVNGITTLTLDDPVVAVGNAASLTNIIVQALLPGSYYSINNPTTSNATPGVLGALTTTDTFATLLAATTQYPNPSTWTYVYTRLGAGGVPTINSFGIALNGNTTLTGATPSTAIVDFANTNASLGALEVLRGGFLIAPTNLLDNSVTFTYNIPSANLILVQNNSIPKTINNTYYTWSLERINMSATTLQTLNINVQPNCKMLMVLTPQQNGCVSVLDNLTAFRMRLDEIDTSNRNILANTNTFYSLLARNYGSFRMLKSLVRAQSDDVDPQKDCIVLSQAVEFPCNLFKLDMYSTTNMSTKILYVYQLLQMNL